MKNRKEEKGYNFEEEVTEGNLFNDLVCTERCGVPNGI